MAAVAAPRETPRPQSSRPNGVRSIWATEDDEDRPRDEPAETDGAAWVGLAKGLSLLLGTLIAVDLFGGGGLPAGGLWWLDTRPLPDRLAAGLLGFGSAALVAFAAFPSLPRLVRAVAVTAVVLLLAVALKDATVYYGLMKRGDLHAGPAVAFPLHIAGCLGVVLLAMRSAGPVGFRGTALALAGSQLGLIALGVAHLACAGPVDHRRAAAAAVVFAPRPFESDPDARLAARLRVAAALFKAGLVPRVLVAGDASESVRRLAVAAGLPETAVEPFGTRDEAATVRLLDRTFPPVRGERPLLLAVSDIDHLPRIEVAARRAGVRLEGVPAASGPARATLLRESVALWRSYFRR